MLTGQALIIAAIFTICVVAQTVPSCGCVAKQQGWTINCANVAFVNASLNFLEGNACNSAKCKTDAGCRQAFFIVNAHHDYCFEDDLPEAIEIAVHKFETFCDQCKVLRKYNPSLPVCPAPTCSSPDTAISAMAFLLANNCTQHCNTTACASNYKTVRAFHDLCAESDIPESVEDGIHDVEGPCEQESCNAASAPFDPNSCASFSASHVVPFLAIAMIVIIATSLI